ncbi:unnamed protein product, partial [Tetraodon nigroviridis]
MNLLAAEKHHSVLQRDARDHKRRLSRSGGQTKRVKAGENHLKQLRHQADLGHAVPVCSLLSSPPSPPPGQLTGPCDLQPGEQNTTLRRELKQFLGWARKHASGCSAVSIKLYDEWRAWLQKSHRIRHQ